MKSLLLATSAVAAFAAAPAFAQDAVGSIGMTYANSEVEVLGLEAEGDGVILDASFAMPVAADWTVTVDTGFSAMPSMAPRRKTTAPSNARIHGSRRFGNVRVGGFAGGRRRPMPPVELRRRGPDLYGRHHPDGFAAYKTVEGSDADIWSVGGDAACYVTPGFRVNGGAGYTTVDLDGFDTDGWQANMGTEYQLRRTGFSLTANYGHRKWKTSTCRPTPSSSASASASAAASAVA